MNITILCVGKLKEKYWRDAEAEYSKRLKRFVNLQITELKESLLPANASPADEAAVKEAEGEAILAKIKSSDHVISPGDRRKRAFFHAAFCKDRGTGASGEKQHRLRHRRLSGAVSRSQPAGRFQTFLFRHDLPPSDDAHHPAGAGLSQFQDHSPRSIP